MIEFPKQNDGTDNRKDKAGDNSKSKKVSYSNDSKTNHSGRRRKYPKPGEESSRYIILNNPKTREINPNQPTNMAKHKARDAPIVSPISQLQLENQRNKRDLMSALNPGMKFTGLIDEVIPRGYLITIRVGNGLCFHGEASFSSHILGQTEAGVNGNVPWACPTNVDHTQENHSHNLNQEKEKDHLRNTWNQESCKSFDINKTLEFEIDDEFHSDYSDFEMPPLPEPHVPDPLLVTNKFVPVVFKQVNPLTRVPIDQTKSLDKGKCVAKDYNTPNPKGYRVGIDPFLPRKFPSPAISISPPYDGVRKRNFSTEILGSEKIERPSQPGSSSLNQNTRQHVLFKDTGKAAQYQPPSSNLTNMMHSILTTSHRNRLIRKYCERGSSCEQQKNNVFIDLEGDQDDDDTNPNSTS